MAPLASLRQLVHFRAIAIAAQVVAVAVAYFSDLAIAFAPMAGIIVALLVVNVLLTSRLHSGAAATHREVFAQLTIDLAAFTAMLLLSGGTANPFVLLYFLHVALIALLLPRHLVIAGTVLVLLGSTICAELATPLKLTDGREVPPSLMYAARWMSFALCTAMIAWFVSRVSAALHMHERLLAEAARKALNDEAVMRIGTIAAGAAHELSSPLTSMAVIVKEWQRQGAAPHFKRDAEILASQITACKEALVNLRAAARQARFDDDGAMQPLDKYLEDLAERCRAIRPGVNLECQIEGSRPAPVIVADPALKQAILILLNNAADASLHFVAMTAQWNDRTLELSVSDRGSGIPPAKLRDLGHTFFTTKPPGKGTGLGAMLTVSTVGRLGGSVSWSNRLEGGAIAKLRLPLSSLQRNVNRG